MKNAAPENKSVLSVTLWLLLPALAFLWGITGCKTNQTGQAREKTSPGQTVTAPATSPPAEMTLREGDVVHVAFPASPSLDTTQQIRRDGKIVMPLIGEVTAAGKTPEELQNELIKRYEPQLSTKQVVVTVQSSVFTVYVTGAVLRPGPIQSDHPLTALEAVMEAGGFDPAKANLKAVTIVREEPDGTRKFTVNLKKAMQGEAGKPFYLKPSDIVNVPEKFTWF